MARRGAPPPAATRTRGRGRGTRSGGSPSARATPLGARRSPRRRGAGAWNAVSKDATAGTPGSSRPIASRPASAAGWCSGARSDRLRIALITAASTSAGPVNLVPPWTTRCPTASTGPRDAIASARAAASAPWPPVSIGPRSCDPARTSSWSRTRSLRLLEPALTTRIRSGSVTRRSATPSSRPRAGPHPPVASRRAPRSACRPSAGGHGPRGARGGARGRSRR